MRRFLANVPWPTIIAIAILAPATWYELYSPWGVLFVWWSLQGIRSGEAFLVQRINQGENPILFWLINLGWLAFGVVWVLYAPTDLDALRDLAGWS